MSTDRDHLDKFLTAIDASPTALERPVCRGWVGDYQITGKYGHVLAGGTGYLLYVTGTVQRWKKAKRQLAAVVAQDGDDEGIMHLDRPPTQAEADTIRDLIGIRKRRHMTAAALSKLERARGSIKSPNLAPDFAPEPDEVDVQGRVVPRARYIRQTAQVAGWGVRPGNVE